MSRLLFSDLGVPLHLPQTHVTRLTGPIESTPHMHDFYEVLLVLEGNGIHKLNRQLVDISACQLIAIRPTDHHSFAAAAGKTLVFANVAVSSQWWTAFHMLHGLTEWDPARRTATLTPNQTVSLGAEMARHYSDYDVAAFLSVWQRVTDFIRAPVRPHRPAPPPWLESLRLDLVKMPEALIEPIGFWQERSGCTAEHLARSCRKFYGITLRELINVARTDRAKFLLRTTDRKIMAIAYECGYENIANFYRTFSRLTGMTPREWRERGNRTVPLPSTIF